MQYDEKANGRQVEATLNEEFEIVLPEVRTAGYHWKIVTKGEPPLQLLADERQPNADSVGGAGRHRWRFRADAVGTSEIRIQYARPWEDSAESARTFELKVRVQS